MKALASVLAHAAAFRRRYCARPRSRVQCRCAALAGGRAGRGGRCCCRCRESNCRQAGARRRSATFFACCRALLYHARPPRAAGGAAGHGCAAAVWCCVSWSVVSSGERRLDAKRPSCTHSVSIFKTFTLPDGVRAVGSAAHDSCCSSCHRTDRRLDLGLARRALARRRCSQHNHRALHGAAAARVRVCQSLGVKGHTSLRRGTVLHRSTAYIVAPPPAPRSAQAALRASAAGRCSRWSSSSSSDRGPSPREARAPCPPPFSAPLPR